MNFSVTKDGKPFANYTWDEKTRTFSTKEDGLVLDFSGVDGVTFKTGLECAFHTGDLCTFSTGGNCTFKTGHSCTFKTYWNCTFDTSYNCTFHTSYNCNFKTGHNCTFKTGQSCTFTTGNNCTFNTNNSCTFDTGENCFTTRNDVPGVTEIPQNKKIKLNDWGIGGYTEVDPTHTIVIDGKEVKISEESYQSMKKSLTL